MRFCNQRTAALLLFASCAAFPALADDPKCPKPLSDDDGCERIKDFDELKDEIEDMRDGDTKCFKEFSVKKGRNEDEIKIKNKRINIICAEVGGCEIEGGGTHIRINGDDAEVMIHGFKFVGASDSAIQIMEDAGRDGPDEGHDQKICDCEFHKNEAVEHGGAIRMRMDTRVYVRYSVFTDNYSDDDGGAIYNDGGRLKVLDSKFENNEADVGGGIASRNAGVLSLGDNHFIDNKAHRVGPAVAASGRFDNDGDNKAVDNDEDKKCNGVYDLDKGKCRGFDSFNGRGDDDDDDDDDSNAKKKKADDDDDDSSNKYKKEDDDDDSSSGYKSYPSADNDDDDDSSNKHSAYYGHGDDDDDDDDSSNKHKAHYYEHGDDDDDDSSMKYHHDDGHDEDDDDSSNKKEHHYDGHDTDDSSMKYHHDDGHDEDDDDSSNEKEHHYDGHDTDDSSMKYHHDDGHDEDDDDDDSGTANYDDGEKFGPFRIKLYWEKGYNWQDNDKDFDLCMECDGRCRAGDKFELRECSSREEKQFFYAVGNTIRNNENRNLCMTHVDQRAIALERCNGSIKQQWDSVKKYGKFELHPATNKERCMTNHHHPRVGEPIYLEYCHIAHEGNTMFWILK